MNPGAAQRPHRRRLLLAQEMEGTWQQHGNGTGSRQGRSGAVADINPPDDGSTWEDLKRDNDRARAGVRWR